jgi:hypothetical protein
MMFSGRASTPGFFIGEKGGIMQKKAGKMDELPINAGGKD